MKKILSSLVLILLLSNFIACSSDNQDGIEIEKMILSQEYTLNIGDEINKVNSDATIEIIQNSENNDTIYILTQGEAEISRLK